MKLNRLMSARSLINWILLIYISTQKLRVWKSNRQILGIDTQLISSNFLKSSWHVDPRALHIYYFTQSNEMNHFLKCPSGSSGTTFGMFDVYNNAYSHGGKVKIAFDRYFIVPTDGKCFFTSSVLQKRSKYGNRNSMADITMRIALVVRYSCICE